MENLHFIKYRKDESIVFSRENFDFAIIKDNNIKKIDKALEKVGFGSKALSEYMSTNKCNLKCKYVMQMKVLMGYNIQLV